MAGLIGLMFLCILFYDWDAFQSKSDDWKGFVSTIGILFGLVLFLGYAVGGERWANPILRLLAPKNIIILSSISLAVFLWNAQKKSFEDRWRRLGFTTPPRNEPFVGNPTTADSSRPFNKPRFGGEGELVGTRRNLGPLDPFSKSRWNEPGPGPRIANRTDLRSPAKREASKPSNGATPNDHDHAQKRVNDVASAVKNEGNGLERYSNAAAKGDPEAQVAVGDIYLDGENVPIDHRVAFEWYQKAAAQGYALGQTRLGLMYLNGFGVPRDEAKAFNLFQMSAAQGDPEGQNGLGRSYFEGKGVANDDIKAFEQFHKAAEQGLADAENSLGTMYDLGRGVPKDYAKAAEWYQKAAVQGYAGAQLNFGSMYEAGRGVPKDQAKALEWYQKSAEQGHVLALMRLAVMHLDGIGVPKDETKAVEWYEKAAAQDFAEAQTMLGILYLKREGVPEREAKALELFQKAAEQGHMTAQAFLGEMYSQGMGVARDDVRAYAWFNLAAAQGEKEAGEARDALEKQMTAEQRAEAQKLSAELFSKMPKN